MSSARMDLQGLNSQMMGTRTEDQANAPETKTALALTIRTATRHLEIWMAYSHRRTHERVQ